MPIKLIREEKLEIKKVDEVDMSEKYGFPKKRKYDEPPRADFSLPLTPKIYMPTASQEREFVVSAVAAFYNPRQ